VLTASSHNGASLLIRVSGFPIRKLTCPLDSRSSDSRYALVLSLPGYALVHATTSHMTTTIYFCQGFGLSNAEVRMSTGLTKCRSSICRWTTSCRAFPRCFNLRHVSPLTDSLDLPGILRLEVSRFSPPRESRFPNDYYPDGYASHWDFSSVVHEGLTPSQFSADQMVVRSLNQDPTIQIRSSCALTPEAKLCVPSPDPMADGFFTLDMMAVVAPPELLRTFFLHLEELHVLKGLDLCALFPLRAP
jgi:hypothetical protein